MKLLKLAIILSFTLTIYTRAFASDEMQGSEKASTDTAPAKKPPSYWRPHGSLGAGILPLMSLQIGMTNGTHSFDYGSGFGDPAAALLLFMIFDDYGFQKGSQYFRYRYTTVSGFYAGLGVTDYWYQERFDSNDADSDDVNKTCIGCAEEVGYAAYHQIGPELSLGFTSNVSKKGFFFSIDFVSYMKPVTDYGNKKVYSSAPENEQATVRGVADEWIKDQSMKDQIFSRMMVFSWGGRF